MIAAALAAALLLAPVPPVPSEPVERLTDTSLIPFSEEGLRAAAARHAQALPVQANRDRQPDGEKLFLQAVTGSAVGVAAGFVTLVGAYGRGSAGLALASPFVHAAAQAAVAHHIGRTFDKEDAGTFNGTLIGSTVGTAAGIGVMLIAPESKGSFLAALGLSSAGAVIGYDLSRPSANRAGAVRVERKSVHMRVPRPEPYAVHAPDGRTSAGVRMPLLSVGF